MKGTFAAKGIISLPYLVGLVVLLMMGYGWLRGGSVNVAGSGTMAGEVVLSEGALKGEASPACHGSPSTAPGGATFLDPVCRMQVGKDICLLLEGEAYYFCTENCEALFVAAPEKYLADTCLVCRADDAFTPSRSEFKVLWEGDTYYFCGRDHADAFRRDPGGYFLHTMWGIPDGLYYLSITLVMLLSFFFFETQTGNRTTAGVRIDLLRLRPLRWLLTRPWTRFTLQAFTVVLFLLIIAAGLFGNQLPSKNIAPLLTWTIWWGGLVLVILYLGKAFCYACPWDALAGWVESLRLWGPRREGLGLELKVSRALKYIWPATFLFVLLTWIELGLGVTLKPRATAYMALGILALAVVSAFVFERRFFCRYVCLVGRISGLYALFSPIEVRARDPEVCRTCTTHSCYKGNESGNGCPTWQFPGTMPNNTYCTMCLECVRTCEPQNMTLRLRPWGEDLKAIHRPRLDEAVLALVLLALTGFHGLTMTGAWRDLTANITQATGWGKTMSFSMGMTALLVGPVALYAILIAMSCRLSSTPRSPTLRSPTYGESFIRYSYTLLPIAFFYHIAHNAEHLLMEGQKLVALISDPFGWEWNLFGTAHLDIAPLVTLTTLWGIQALLVLVGHLYGVWAACKVSENLYPNAWSRRAAHVPLLVAMILFSVFSLWLLKQPMEMRTSGM